MLLHIKNFRILFLFFLFIYLFLDSLKCLCSKLKFSFLDQLMASTAICSINDCKRAATCLCHHCKKNVCSKHFNEHQAQINNELFPLTDRLNERNNVFIFIIL